jgi:hypothetical protein
MHEFTFKLTTTRKVTLPIATADRDGRRTRRGSAVYAPAGVFLRRRGAAERGGVARM